MDIGRTLSKSGVFPPPIAAVRRLAGLSQSQLAAACQCPTPEISAAERGRWKPRCRRLVWLTYLLYLHRDPEWGWLRAALLLPPVDRPGAPISGYTESELSRVLSRVSRRQAQLVRDKLVRDSGYQTKKQGGPKSAPKRPAGGRPGRPGQPRNARPPAPPVVVVDDDDEDVRPG